jgi:hypothetical protein
MEHFGAYVGVVVLLRKGREIPISGRQLVALTLIFNRADCSSCSGLIRMWRHVGHRLGGFLQVNRYPWGFQIPTRESARDYTVNRQSN